MNVESTKRSFGGGFHRVRGFPRIPSDWNDVHQRHGEQRTKARDDKRAQVESRSGDETVVEGGARALAFVVSSPPRSLSLSSSLLFCVTPDQCWQSSYYTSPTTKGTGVVAFI